MLPGSALVIALNSFMYGVEFSIFKKTILIVHRKKTFLTLKNIFFSFFLPFPLIFFEMFSTFSFVFRKNNILINYNIFC